MQSTLKTMSEISFSEYLENAIPGYARDNIDSGRWPEQGAIERSREDHLRLLPDGVKTTDNHLFDILSVEEGIAVGILWMAVDDKFGVKSAFIYDIEIKEEFQRRGYARSALIELEGFATSLGINSIGLHVFRQNSSAQSLYNSLGYNVVSSNMVKSIS